MKPSTVILTAGAFLGGAVTGALVESKIEDKRQAAEDKEHRENYECKPRTDKPWRE